MSTLTIEEATERLIDYRGKTPPKTNSGIRLVTAKVVKGGQINDEPAEYIAADFYDEWMRRGLPQKLDVLLTTEAPLGEVAILRDESRIALAQRIILLRAKPGLVDPMYLFYALQSDFGQGELKARGTGTTVLGIKQSELRKVRIPAPPLPAQKRIGEILSAYDELIENGQRRIKILETMARALYREWFVHFRFPGSENHPRVASALGEIPQGWVVKKIANLVEFKKGKKPTDVVLSGDSGLKRHLLIDALRGGSSQEFVSPEKLIATSADDTIMVMDGSGSSDVFIGHEGVIGSTLGRYRVDSNSTVGPFWLFLFFSDHVDEIKSKNVGSAIPHANKDFINGMDVVIAPESVMQSFDEAVAPLFGLIRSLRSKTNTLRRTRDLLLPRLLSGQVSLDV
jgi:type I restriction enzyme S subunit